MSDKANPSRRKVLAGAAVAGVGLDLFAFVRPARASAITTTASADLLARIEQAGVDVKTATAAFDEAIGRLEASLPRIHRDLVWRRGGRLPHGLCSIERRFDGAVTQRGLDLRGLPGDRYLALPRLIAAELEEPRYDGGRGWRRFLRLTLKNSRRYQARLARAEAPAVQAERAMTMAKRRLGDIAAEILDEPATTPEALTVKAHALVAFTAADDQSWRRCQAGPWGAQLAREMLEIVGRTV